LHRKKVTELNRCKTANGDVGVKRDDREEFVSNRDAMEKEPVSATGDRIHLHRPRKKTKRQKRLTEKRLVGLGTTVGVGDETGRGKKKKKDVPGNLPQGR